MIKPPRALFVPYELGFPLGEPDNAGLQHEIIAAALDLVCRMDTPVLEYFSERRR